MARLQTMAADCEYHECDRRLTKQLINRLDNEVTIGKIQRQLTAVDDIDEVTVKWV